MRDCRIVVKVYGEDPKVFTWGETMGEARIVKNAVLIYPRDESLPEVLSSLKKKHCLLVEMHEEGGGYTNTGSASIVCGEEGEALRPVRVLRAYAGGKHALFAAPSLIYVYADRRRSEISVEIVRVSATPDGIKEDPIWKGDPEDLPNLF